MKAFVLAVENYLLFDSTIGTNTKRTIGAFIPEKEGNYYRELLIGFNKKNGKYSMSFSSWWEWLKSSFAKGDTLIDDEFSFDPEDVRIISFDIPIKKITMNNCLHECSQIQGFVYSPACVTWGICDKCNEFVTLYALDWWILAWKLWD